MSSVILRYKVSIPNGNGMTDYFFAGKGAHGTRRGVQHGMVVVPMCLFFGYLCS